MNYMSKLSTLIEQEKIKLSIWSKWHRNDNYFLTLLSEPSIWWALIIVWGVVVIFVYIAIWIFQIPLLYNYKINSSSWDIIQSIVTLLLGVLIFSAERFQEDRYSTRILLRQSGLWGLTLCTVVTLGFYFTGDLLFDLTNEVSTKSSLLISCLLLIWILYSIGIIIYIILNPDFFSQQKNNLLLRKIDYLSDESIKKRIGNNIFYDRLKNHPTIEYTWLIDTKSLWDQWMPVNAKTTGSIVDLNFNALELTEKAQDSQVLTSPNKIILTKTYAEKVVEGDILWYVSDRKLKKSVEQFYSIKNIADIVQIKNDLNFDLENIIHSIWDRIVDWNALRLTSLYTQLNQYIAYHSEYIHRIDIRFDINNPGYATGWILDSGIWIYWDIQGLIWKIYHLTNNSLNSEIHSAFISFIYTLIFNSASRKDYALLPILSGIIPEFYKNTVCRDNYSIAQNIQTNTDNFVKFFLYSKSQESDSAEERIMLLRFIVLFIRRLIKVAVDNEDVKQFNVFINLIGSIDSNHHDSNFQQMKGKMFFWFIGWIFKKTSTDQNWIYAQMIMKILDNLHTSFEEWLNLFLDSQNSREEDDWSCADWDLPHDGTVYLIDNHTWPKKFFLLWLYQKFVSKHILIEWFEIPRDVRYLNFDHLLKDQDWIAGFNLPSVTSKNTEWIEQIIKQIKEVEIKQSRERRSREVISDAKKSLFFDEIQKWYNSSSSFIKNAFSISDFTENDSHTYTYGFYQLIEKSWFVDQSSWIKGMWVWIWKNLWLSQERLILKRIQHECQEIDYKNDIKCLKQQIKELSKKMKDPIIVVYGTENYKFLDLLLWREIIWHSEDNCRGKIENISVYDCFDNENDSSNILLIDKDKITQLLIGSAKWEIIKSWWSNHILEEFYIEFEDLSTNKNLLIEILKDSPGLIIKSKEEKYESVEDYLKDRIAFKIYFSLDMQLDEHLGYLLKTQ